MQKGIGDILIIVVILVVITIGAGVFYLRGVDNNSFTEKLPLNGFNKIQTENVKDKFEIFPSKLDDFQTPPKAYGLWPYGIKGNDDKSHNEGHPGWDLELKKGSKLYAISDIRINQIHDGDHQTGDGQILRVIEASARLNEGMFGIVYHSVINIEKDVVEGATIKEGSVLAEVGFPLSDTSAMIHFGIFAPNDSVGVCPTNYFSAEVQKIIENVVENSLDIQVGKPYTSACVGKINKEIYYKNFPDRIQYLRGGEVWE